jgi:hypothetical protein
MDPMQYSQLVEQLGDGELALSGSVQCATLLAQLNSLRSWVESRVLAVTQRLDQIAIESPGTFPEQIVADATRVTLTQAMQPFRRAKAVELLPLFGAALTDGSVNVDHVDMLARSVAGLDPATKLRLAERDEFLAEVAARTTSTEFGRTVRAEIRRAQTDDGIARLERQRRDTRLRTWLDHETGMWCLRGEFDPETGGILEKRLNDALEALFHDATPDTCPTDLMQKQHHLRALALFALTAGSDAGKGGVRRAGAIDMSILIDAKTLLEGIVHDTSVVDCGLGIELPVESIRRMACCADVTPIIVGADGVRLELGRTTRLANRAQRRALRAMYRGCAVPGCCVAFDYVVIHHVQYFRNGGLTDVANLLPLCSKHHHLAHEGGWQFTLGADRTLEIIRADGTRMTTGPPKVLAA